MINAVILSSLRCSSGPIATREDPKLQSFKIPLEAQLRIESHFIEPNHSESFSAEFCRLHRPTEDEIKKQFDLARLLNPQDSHDNYIHTPCLTQGVIIYNGRTTKWIFRLGNVIETTFPDGVKKILGGQPSDSPSGSGVSF